MDDRDADARRHRLAFGAAVRELRARCGLSQEETGFRGRLHRNYVGAIERGEINPTFRVLLKLARGLDLRLSELIREQEQIAPAASRLDMCGCARTGAQAGRPKKSSGLSPY
jgi:transcriptional regulator with XRE-family HTH domain